uniref:hypothetical protein n=1 Tax=Flavobacterium sp. TaxID=239 RepID=UPI00404891AF
MILITAEPAPTIVSSTSSIPFTTKQHNPSLKSAPAGKEIVTPAPFVLPGIGIKSNGESKLGFRLLALLYNFK